jgi:hypothetical protein
MIVATEFYVIMQKRGDGKVYTDLHKTDEHMYLVESDAEAALVAKGDLAVHFHVVPMVAMLKEDWQRLAELDAKLDAVLS